MILINMYCPYCVSKEVEKYMQANKYHKELFKCYKCGAVFDEDADRTERERIKNKRKKEVIGNKEKKQKTKIKYTKVLFLTVIVFYFFLK